MEHYVCEDISFERYTALKARIAEIRVVLERRRDAGKDHGVPFVVEAAYLASPVGTN
jgi:hypothetical protein